MKKVALEQKVDRREKENRKMGEIEKLLEVSKGTEKRAEDAVEAWKKVVERRKYETNRWMTTPEDQRKEETKKRLEKRREKEKMLAGWYGMTQEQERRMLQANRKK